MTKLGDWVRNAFTKAPEAKPKRVRESRAVVRRAGASPWPWDAPVYRGEVFDYDVGSPPPVDFTQDE